VTYLVPNPTGRSLAVFNEKDLALLVDKSNDSVARPSEVPNLFK